LSAIAAISTKRTTTLSHWNTKKTTACVVGKPSSGLGWVQKCDGVKPADGITALPLIIVSTMTNTDRFKQ